MRMYRFFSKTCQTLRLELDVFSELKHLRVKDRRSEKIGAVGIARADIHGHPEISNNFQTSAEADHLSDPIRGDVAPRIPKEIVGVVRLHGGRVRMHESKKDTREIRVSID